MSKDKSVSPTDNEEVSTLDQQTESSSASDNQDLDKSEESSTSGESKSEVSTLDLVKDALSKEPAEEDETEGSSEKDETVAEESKDKLASEDSDEMSDEELEVLRKLKPKTAKRFEQLQAKYRNANERAEKAEVDAGYYKQFTNFLQNNNLSQEEANALFDAGAALKNDKALALQIMTPIYNQLLIDTGNVLPKDIHQQVEQKQIPEHVALELSRQRAHARNVQIAEEQRRQNQIIQEQNHQTQLRSDIQDALANLESQWQKSDPDYKLKSTRITERVKLTWYEAQRNGTMPKSVDEAIKIVTGVKMDVEKEFRKFAPKKSVNPVDGGSSVSAKAEPQSTLDVIRQTLGA